MAQEPDAGADSKVTQQRQREVIAEMVRLCDRHDITVYDVIDRYFTEYTDDTERVAFLASQLGHALTNLPVEWLRHELPASLNPDIKWLGRQKDAAYWLGHGVLVALCAIPFALWLL